MLRPLKEQLAKLDEALKNATFVKCPKCGGEWSQLKDSGLCYDCNEAAVKQKETQKRIERSKNPIIESLKKFAEGGQ